MIPKLSVCVVCYNQKSFIGNCIQSIVEQKTDFAFELIIADDGSVDGTRDLLIQFQQTYPEIIKLKFNSKNLGALENYKHVHRLAIGAYVAHVDGDDCVYQGKLQQQVDFLDANPHVALVAHRVDLWDGCRVVNVTSENPSEISLEYLIIHHPIFLNSATMYRRSLVGGFAFASTEVIDFYMYVFATLRGKVGFINQILGRYTINVGISSKRNLMGHVQAALDLAVGHVDTDVLARARAKQFVSYAIAALIAGDASEFKQWIGKAYATGGCSRVASYIYWLRNFSPLLLVGAVLYKRSRLAVFKIFRGT